VLVRGLLEWVANQSGVDEAVIRGWLRDVSAYLELPGCRPAVQEVVRPALLTDPAWVLVGHSLGAVVCAELLAEEEVRARAGVFVPSGRPWAWTGSPLGCGPGARPGRPPRSFGHSIEHYLAHPQVATSIADALDASAWIWGTRRPTPGGG
jgi:pimeloyl-ACP methyl ester carboxylesterase